MTGAGMTIPLRISFHQMPSSSALEDHIREKVQSLEQLHPNLTRCNVTIEQPHHHKNQGNAFNVRIDLYVPGDEIVVNRDANANEDPMVALRDAFEAARRQVVKHAQKKRGDVKRHSLPGSGEAGVEES